VGLIVWAYPFDKSPSLQSVARDLSREHELRLFVDPRHSRGLPADLADLLAVEPAAAPPPAAGGAYARGAVERIVRDHAPAAIRALAREAYVVREVARGLPGFVARLRAAPAPDVWIAADKTSLWASRLAGLSPGIYFSLEATPCDEETSWLYRRLNRLEARFVARTNPLVIAQSPARAGLVQPDATRHVLLPVTSDGDSLPPSTWLRERHGIQPWQRVLVIAGGLGVDQLTPEIVRATARWDESLVLVLHSASGLYPPELAALARDPAISPRVRLSSDHFTIKEAECRIYAGADLGIVYYRDLGFNFRHTAYSSGKLAAFLRAGVPVIVPPFGEFENAVRVHGYGACADVERIGEVALRLLERRDELREAARHAFETVYRFERYAGRAGLAVARVIEERSRR